MTEKMCLHCYVSGKVQGVWFRASTEEKATELGLTGWVRNLPDGRVEVMVCGERETVAQMQAWLMRGPELARVTEVTQEVLAWEKYVGFVVR